MRSWSRKYLAPAVVSTSLTAMVVGVGVAGVDTSDPSPATTALRVGAGAALDGDLAAFEARGERAERASRTVRRVTLEPQAVAHKWATADLNARTGPGVRFERAGVIEDGQRVAVTGQAQRGWAEVLLQGRKGGTKVRWVNAEYLSKTKPQPPEPPAEAPAEQSSESSTAEAASAPAGLSGAPCPHGSSIEGGLNSNGDRVYRAVCAAFPSVTSYGGLRPGDSGAHGSGRGLDIMISGAAGWEIAEYLRANAGALGVSEVIYAQKIWTVQRSGEGWRYMSDRGSVTANHYDHVHVTVY